ncbi:SPOR domain-containing protein [Acetobacteraceae bacterium ESL0709]|nr:SPOR domain-containing protein [Acetobacteraceae bacterium ESL0697]MDF7677679.1 SPOR domain-containing protein [Acetobacteraceae bacterium ESL0709]
MSEPGDEKRADVTPPRLDERLDASAYADGPRARLGGSSGAERPTRRPDYAQQGGVLTSLLGRDPATRKLMGGALVIVLVLLGAVGAWSLFGKRHQGIPVIAPPAIALRDRPADPGGMQIMSDDSLQGDVTGKGEVHLAPPAEQPDARVLAHKDNQNEAPSAQHPLQSDIPSSRNAQGNAPSSSPSSPDKAVTAQAGLPKGPQSDIVPSEGLKTDNVKSESLKPEMAGQNTALPKDVIQNSATNAASAPAPDLAPDLAKGSSSQTTESHKSEEAPVTPPAAKPSMATGSSQVQLAALDSKEKAQQVWAQLQERFPDLFGNKTPLYSQTVHNGHNFTRLRVGGFADSKAAKAFCAQLQAHSVPCTPAFF